MKYLALGTGWVYAAMQVSALGQVAAPNHPEIVEKRPIHLNSVSINASTLAQAKSTQFDFVPGRTVLIADDFTCETLGTFPASWRTNSTGEIVTLDELPGHWLTLNKTGQFMPDSVKTLPDEFTLQFDLVCSNPYNFYSTGFYTVFAALKNPAAEFGQWNHATPGNDGVAIMLHPMDVSGQRGHSEVSVLANHERQLRQEKAVQSFWANGRNLVKVSVWRQQQRLRLYVNDEKVWDLPQAFQAKINYNALIFSVGNAHRDTDSYYLSNLRLASNDTYPRPAK